MISIANDAVCESKMKRRTYFFVNAIKKYRGKTIENTCFRKMLLLHETEFLDVSEVL